jgi:hypothetical protein
MTVLFKQAERIPTQKASRTLTLLSMPQAKLIRMSTTIYIGGVPVHKNALSVGKPLLKISRTKVVIAIQMARNRLIPYTLIFHTKFLH